MFSRRGERTATFKLLRILRKREPLASSPKAEQRGGKKKKSCIALSPSHPFLRKTPGLRVLQEKNPWLGTYRKREKKIFRSSPQKGKCRQLFREGTITDT